MKFLLRINREHFGYLESVGRPFTIPRLQVYTTINEQEDYKMYLQPKTQEIKPEEKLNKLIEMNPALEKLIGILEMQNSESKADVPF